MRGVYEGLDEVGAHGEHVAAPPWILGHRGTPREAPENTLAGLRRAADIGLDGFEYDLRACASGEAILIHDATLERTTDSSGAVADKGLPELFGVDAGGWFAKRFAGEPLAVFDEALDIAGSPGRGWPLHMIELKERGLVDGVARKLRDLKPELPVRVASADRETVLEVRDAGLAAMLLADRARGDDRTFVRDERLAAYGVGPGGWSTEAGGADWSFCERWSWSLDDPQELYDACRAPLFGFNTNEPYRAMAVRALVALAPEDDGPYPLGVPELFIEPERLQEDVRRRGEWYGSWSISCAVRNPFPFDVEVRCGVFLPNGAFEITGLPAVFDLSPGETRDVPLRLTGGSRAPGDDPLFAALLRWRAGTGSVLVRPGGKLLLDAPLRRRRVVSADPVARRLTMLAEDPDDPAASMTLRRQGTQLTVAIENPGDLADAHVLVHLDGELRRGGRGLRLALPPDFDLMGGGLSFSCGMEGTRGGERRVRRWAGGLPEGLSHGTPGLIVPLGQG